MAVNWWVPLLAAILAFGLTPLVGRLARRLGAVDAPGERKVHKKTMPRMGGLAIFGAFLVGSILLVPLRGPILGLLLGAGIVLAVGVMDDLRGLAPWQKLLGQVAGALVMAGFGGRVEFLTNPFNGVLALGFWSIPVTVIWLVGVSNAVNLIDGLDGLAAGTAAIAALTLALVAWLEGQELVMALSLVLMAANLGFLPFNFHPARIFMGDSGSLFLGFVLGGLALLGLAKTTTFLSVVVPVIILGVPLADTSLAIARRVRRKQPVFQADRRHLHHRLLDFGLSHRQTVVTIYGIDAALGVSALVLNLVAPAKWLIVFVGLATMILVMVNKLWGMRKAALLGKQLEQRKLEG